jgi:hypothetical protein
MRTTFDACQELKTKNPADAYASLLDQCKKMLGIDISGDEGYTVARIGAMLRLTTALEGKKLCAAFSKMSELDRSEAIEFLSPAAADRLPLTPTYMPLILVTPRTMTGSLEQSLKIGLPILCEGLRQYQDLVAKEGIDSGVRLEFNQIAGSLKTRVLKLTRGDIVLDAKTGIVNYNTLLRQESTSVRPNQSARTGPTASSDHSTPTPTISALVVPGPGPAKVRLEQLGHATARIESHGTQSDRENSSRPAESVFQRLKQHAAASKCKVSFRKRERYLSHGISLSHITRHFIVPHRDGVSPLGRSRNIELRICNAVAVSASRITRAVELDIIGLVRGCRAAPGAQQGSPCWMRSCMKIA